MAEEVQCAGCETIVRTQQEEDDNDWMEIDDISDDNDEKFEEQAPRESAVFGQGWKSYMKEIADDQTSQKNDQPILIEPSENNENNDSEKAANFELLFNDKKAAEIASVTLTRVDYRSSNGHAKAGTEGLKVSRENYVAPSPQPFDVLKPDKQIITELRAQTA